MIITHFVNEFNEVVPVINGRASNNINDRRKLTDFEIELFAIIEKLEEEMERLKKYIESICP